MRLLFMVAITLLMSIFYSIADEPLSSPSTYTFFSENGKIEIISDSNTNKTIAFTNENQKTSKLWEIPGWHRSIFISNDGKYCIIGYEGQNLLPLNYDGNEIVFSIYLNGIVTKKVYFNEIIKNRKKLQRTSSHYYWGYIEKFENNIIFLNTVEGFIKYDVSKFAYID